MERAVKTAAQSIILYLGISENASISIESFASWEPWAYGAGGFVLSLLTSLASKKVGNPSSASLVRL